MSKKENSQSFMQIMRNNLYLIKLCFKAAPCYLILILIEMVRNEVVVFLEFTFGLNYVLECAEFGKPFEEAAFFLIGLLIFVMLGLLYNAFVYQKLQMKYEPVMKKALKEMLYNKAREIDIECYDNPAFYNDYILAVSESENQVDRMFGMLGCLITGITSIVLSGAFFVTNDPASFIFIIMSFVFSLFIGNIMSKLNFKIRNEKNPYERKLGYINRVFYLNDYAKEIRLNTEISSEMLEDFDDISEESLKIDKMNASKRFWFGYLKDYVCCDFIIDVLYIIYLIYKATVLRSISYSNVAVMRTTARRTQNRMRMFSDVYPRAQEISLYIEKIKAFLKIENKIRNTGTKNTPNNPTVIELKNISFRYNERSDYILKNLNMKICAYDKVAIVGYNGAGKTTLIKLIMRLYDPDEGEILLDGINIKDYDILQYRKKISTVFQDFKIFAATVKENVILDFSHKGSDDDTVSALNFSGFSDRLKTLENGLKTNLTTEFEEDGVNLSGGENQKVAIARVFYADSNLIILDEPSSALDPIAEYNLNHSILNAASQKSVIFISHRLSTTRIADRIYMLENGRIIEEGNHNELLSKNGKYAEMWKVQAGQYLVK